MKMVTTVVMKTSELIDNGNVKCKHATNWTKYTSLSQKLLRTGNDS